MRERMRFRLRRIRQDSEMSTFSDWNPSNSVLQRYCDNFSVLGKFKAFEEVWCCKWSALDQIDNQNLYHIDRK